MKIIFFLFLSLNRLLALSDNEFLNSLTDTILPTLRAEAKFVSLGSHCWIAGMLDRFHLRKNAYPFDWLLTIDESRFIELINNDFEHLIDWTYLISHPVPESVGIMVHTYYHIEFRHDWHSTLWGHHPNKAKEMELLENKYARRINRFRSLDNSSGRVFFIRSPYSGSTHSSMYWPNEGGLRITDSSAICLNHVLKNKFPHLDYVLLIVDQDENFKQDSFEKIEENLFKINYCKPTSMRDERMIETIFDIHRIITPSGN